MMINKRLIGTVKQSKRYIAGNVICQWVSLAANIVMMAMIAHLLQQLYDGGVGGKQIGLTAGVAVITVVIRYICAKLASRMSYLSAKTVKKTLREMIYSKLLRQKRKSLSNSRRAMRSEQEVNRVIEQHADTVKRICVMYLKNASDTEGIFQEVFLKYALSSVLFESAEHEKAWLIRVTINECKDVLKSMFHRKATLPLEEIKSLPAEQKADYSEVIGAVAKLPSKYRDVVYLYYYEGYSAVEIGRILDKNTNTIYTLLARAKNKLKEKLGGCEIGT